MTKTSATLPQPANKREILLDDRPAAAPLKALFRYAAAEGPRLNYFNLRRAMTVPDQVRTTRTTTAVRANTRAGARAPWDFGSGATETPRRSDGSSRALGTVDVRDHFLVVFVGVHLDHSLDCESFDIVCNQMPTASPSSRRVDVMERVQLGVHRVASQIVVYVGDSLRFEAIVTLACAAAYCLHQSLRCQTGKRRGHSGLQVKALVESLSPD